MVAVAVVQLKVDDAEPALERLQRTEALVSGLAGSADLVLLPEMWPVGAFNSAAALAAAEPLNGEFATRMGAAAAAAGLWLHAGSFPERHDGSGGLSTGTAAEGGGTTSASAEGGGRPGAAAIGGGMASPVSNTSVLFAPDGRLVLSYRKIHLFGFDEGEAVQFAAGTTTAVAPTPLGVTGLTTCYDLRFPELFRHLLDEGVEAFLLPAGWPAARAEHWTALARARAIENQAIVVAGNAVGTNGGVPMAGLSAVYGPDGQVLAQAGPTAEEVLVVDVDPAQVPAYRASFPVLRDRRL